jgi:hypothetical protein
LIGQVTAPIRHVVVLEPHVRLVVRMLLCRCGKREAKLFVADLVDMWAPEFIARVQRRIDEGVAA